MTCKRPKCSHLYLFELIFFFFFFFFLGFMERARKLTPVLFGLFSPRFPRLLQHVREEEEAAGDLGSVQLRAPRAHGLRPARAEVHRLAAAMAEPAVGHGQPAQAHGGPLLHHPHPAGSHEGESESRRRPRPASDLITMLLCALSPTSPSLTLSFDPQKNSPRLISALFYSTLPQSFTFSCVYMCKCLSALFASSYSAVFPADCSFLPHCCSIHMLDKLFPSVAPHTS